MASVDKITKQILKRTTAYNRLKETYELGLQVASDSSVKPTFLARVEGMDRFYDDFQASHNQIISLISEDDFKTHDAARIAADKCYYGSKAIKNEVSINDPNQSVLNNSVYSPISNKPGTRLPIINLPKFDGDFAHWPSFFDLYNSLVHFNNDLSQVEKFQYLLTSLDKEPAALVKGIPLTENNYVIAYEILEKRYQNKRLLATHYYNELISAPFIQKSSAKELRHILNIFSENLAALRVLNFPVDQWDFLLFNMLLQKLDSKTRTDFEVQHSLTEIPSYLQLKTFLENNCKALESVQFKSCNTNAHNTHSNVNQNKHPSSHSNSGFNNSNFRNRKQTTLVNTITTNNASKCPCCSSSHALYRCSSFTSKTPSERFSFVKQHNLCVNCLLSPHPLRKCGSAFRCRICMAPHHTLLHFEKNDNNNSSNNHFGAVAATSTAQTHSSLENQQPNTTLTSVMTSTLAVRQSTVLLSTAEVEIKDVRGNFQKIRALFDTASMANFISEKCVNRLGLSRKRYYSPIEGINGMSVCSGNGMALCHIKPGDQSDSLFSFEAIVLPKICSEQPRLNINYTNWSHIKHLKLADCNFNVPGPIDILFGAELVPLFLGSGRIFGKPDQPVALETVFGYILQGKTVIDSSVADTSSSLVSCHVSVENQLDFTLQKFWNVEEISKPCNLSPEEKKCEEIFNSLTIRDPTGRFLVPLPFKNVKPCFGDTYSQAYRRFCLLETRLLKNSNLFNQYSDFMQDYLNSHHMSLVPKSDYKSTTAYYIPHHSILKNEISGSKLRVVFDASARGTQGTSLNDSLLVGPKLQRDISSILMTFRFFPYVFICDIKQMYRQIRILPQFQDYQRILWRFSPNDPLDEYHLLTVTYGISSSPFLAIRTLQELANKEETSFPRAAKVIRRDIYVDDAVTGGPDLVSTLALQSELINIMKAGGFELRKWASNHPALLKNIPSSDIQLSCSFDKEEPSFIKVLGLKWDPSNDVFSYYFCPIERPCTKRNILSEISRIFDPIGFISPVMLRAKYILQCLWSSNVAWDETPSNDILEAWNAFKTELLLLTNIKIPRRVISDQVSRIELHGFCDASQIGYASVIYFRVERSPGDILTYLVSAKTKVAPLKTVSIPRLELCAAVLLADLISFVKKSYSEFIIFDDIYAWSDSMVTLTWLSSSAHKWKTFVANRVSHIQDLIPMTSWNYIPSQENPADCASRGLLPSQLLHQDIWWSGPDFLSQRRDLWRAQPTFDSSKNTEISQEEKQTLLTVLIKDDFTNKLLSKFSSLLKVKRIVAYINRFITNLRSQNISNNQLGQLTPYEIEKAFFLIIKNVQSDCFSDIFDKIKNNNLLPKPFRKLAPFVDPDGMLRVGGRLKNSNFDYDIKHPILLPKSHRLTELVIEWVHKTNFHPGLKTLHYLILQQFWILSPRSAIYKCLSNCIQCFRCKPKSYNPYMGDLPKLRISQIKPFSSVCIDFAGPFSLLMSRHRGAKVFKGYVCVFVCTATKAVHLEATSDLTSEAFLAAFRRFVARRGRCSYISSDQGTNLKGASNQLLEYARIAAQQLSIHWNFNPPSTPHFNGLAEAGVKSMKTHLYRVIGTQNLTFEEFYTLLTQIESLLNSRPLSPISADPNDLQPLTPGHFLTLEPLNSGIPEPDFSNININRLNRWQLIQRLQSDFWKRWSNEYIHSLQERRKWVHHAPEIAKGILVLIKHDQHPPLYWELGRVTDLHPGKDGVVRVVTLRTARGSFKRPVVRICPLPGN